MKLPELTTELIVTVGFLAAEVGLILFFRYQMRKPVNPARPRLLPYGAFIMILSLSVIVTIAHTVSLVTGHTLAPRIRQRRF